MPGAIWNEGVEGWVDVEVTVAVDGTAKSPNILDRSIEGIFDKPTLEAVEGWQFQPATRNGRPFETTYEVRQIFYFEDKRDAVSPAFSRRARGISIAFGAGDQPL